MCEKLLLIIKKKIKILINLKQYINQIKWYNNKSKIIKDTLFVLLLILITIFFLYIFDIFIMYISDIISIFINK